MKRILEYIIEYLILEYERIIYSDNDIVVKIGNHGDNRKTRGKDSNFKINLFNINDNKIRRILEQFKNKILDKLSNNTLIAGDVRKTITLIDYNISIVLFCNSLLNDKYELIIKTIELTDDDYGNYSLKYKENQKHKDNKKIFISDIK